MVRLKRTEVSAPLFQVESNHGPRSRTNFHSLRNSVRSQINYGDVVRWAVGRVQSLGVGRQRNPPRTRPDLDRGHRLIGGGIDGEDLVSASGADIETGAVGGKQDTHGLDDA